MPSVGVAMAVTAAGIATGLAMATAIEIAGPVGAIAPAAAGVALLLLRLPLAAFALLLVSAVLIEPEHTAILPPVRSFYDVAAAHLTPQDLLLLAGFGGILLRFATKSERPWLPEPFTTPMVLLGIAVLAGVITGDTAHAGVPVGELFHRSMTAFYLILVPVLTINVLQSAHALRIFAAVAAGLAAFKGISGLYAALGGVGASVEQETISYLNPVPNLVMLIFVLGVAGALLRRVRLPAWMYAMAPVALLALILSYRRSFWIAAIFTLVLVVILASRRRGRAVFALAGVAVALTLGATFLLGSSDPSGSPLAERASTLSPSGFGTNRGDRYRMDERHNVIANIEDHPLTGIGLGVPWTVHFPLAEVHDRRYSHLAVLWYWLSFGVLGVIAYLALFGTALWVAWRVWREHADPAVRIAALACLGGILAMLVVELTATFSGVEARTSLVLGAVFGWLAAAWRELPDRGRETMHARRGAILS